KSGTCMSCHQLGSIGTRRVPDAFKSLPTSFAQWERRVQSGQAGAQMTAAVGMLGHQGPLAMFADWTDRIAAGEVPEAPRRPQGIERNVVITEWDWADPRAYLHDVVSTDRRNPRVNANGNGKRDDYTEPNQPIDPTKDHRINNGLYAVAPAPDGSIWGS